MELAPSEVRLMERLQRRQHLYLRRSWAYGIVYVCLCVLVIWHLVRAVQDAKEVHSLAVQNSLSVRHAFLVPEVAANPRVFASFKAVSLSGSVMMTLLMTILLVLVFYSLLEHRKSSRLILKLSDRIRELESLHQTGTGPDGAAK